MDLLKSLTEDAVGGLESSPVVSVSPDDSVGATIRRLRADHRGMALVREAGKLIGVFTERDVLTRVLSVGMSVDAPVRSVMTAEPVTVARSDSVADVIRRMHAGGYRHLPVVEKNGEVVGVVSVKAVVCYLAEHFPRAIYNLPPDPTQRQTAREGA